MKYLFLNIFLLVFQLHYSQCNFLHETKLSDSTLLQTLDKYIEDTKSKNPEFQNLGYIEVNLIYYNKTAINDDISIRYRISDQYFKPNYTIGAFVNYYCYIKGKLVLIYNRTNKNFLKSKCQKRHQKKLDKIVKPYLKKPIHVKAKDKEGNVIINDKNFIDEKFNIHGGIILSIRNNGKFKIE